jgi:hypothetical protein
MKFFKNYHVLMNTEGEASTGGGGTGGEGGTGGQVQNTQQNAGAGQKSSGNSVDELPEWARNEIKSLRNEAAGHRTSNKELKTKLDTFEQALKKAGLVNEDLPPEKQLETVTAQAETLAIQNALLEIAVENGVPKDQFRYFSFLMNEKLGELGDDEELTEEALTEVLEMVNTAGAGKGSATSSFTGNGKDKGGGSDEVTLEAFSKMTIMAKSKLYQTDKATYDRLMSEAKSKGLM